MAGGNAGGFRAVSPPGAVWDHSHGEQGAWGESGLGGGGGGWSLQWVLGAQLQGVPCAWGAVGCGAAQDLLPYPCCTFLPYLSHSPGGQMGTVPDTAPALLLSCSPAQCPSCSSVPADPLPPAPCAHPPVLTVPRPAQSHSKWNKQIPWETKPSPVARGTGN